MSTKEEWFDAHKGLARAFMMESMDARFYGRDHVSSQCFHKPTCEPYDATKPMTAEELEYVGNRDRMIAEMLP